MHKKAAVIREFEITFAHSCGGFPLEVTVRLKNSGTDH
jgi:hypothetical protein